MMLVCKTAGHDSDHRPGDHGLVVVREPFVVAEALLHSVGSRHAQALLVRESDRQGQLVERNP
jgi:hypothetical protein